MSRHQNIAQIFKGNRKIFFSIKYVHYNYLPSSRVHYYEHLYAKNLRIYQVFVILWIYWEWGFEGSESAISRLSEFIYNLANICRKTKESTNFESDK